MNIHVTNQLLASERPISAKTFPIYLTDVTTKAAIPIGGEIELKDGVKISLSKQEADRLAVVQMVET